MQTVLTIAGFDPSSGAGVTADLMVFAAHALFGTACITALTVQTPLGVRSTHPTSPDVVRATLQLLDQDLPPAGIKIGMIATEDNINEICNYIEGVNLKNSERIRPSIVLDPVLRSTSGRDLLDPSALTALRDRLLPLVDWVTPNLDELAVLAGVDVLRRDHLPPACRALQERIAQCAIAQRPNGRRIGICATGGHLDPPDAYLLLPSGEDIWLPGVRVLTRATQGPGCAVASAFLSRMVLGDAPQKAAQAAKLYVENAMRLAILTGINISNINYLYNIYKQLA